MAQARIGKIKLKSGGAEIRVLHRDAQNLEGENWRGDLIRHARTISEHDDDKSALVGFVIVGLFDDGATSVGYRWDKERVPVPRTLMPAYVAEVIRRDLITECEAERIACNVVNRANGFRDD